MIVTRAPLRVSLAGGGTDLPAYYEQYGGCVISAAIDKYVYICANRSPFIDGYHLRYSKVEHATHAADIEHPICREALAKTEPGIEISVLADVPAGTGLGSSGAFTVALLKALRPDMPDRWLAEEASAIEIDRLGRPIGEQDQYVAAYGGTRCYTFHPSGAVAQSEIDVEPLAERLLLFYVGQVRDSADTLAVQGRATANLHHTKTLAAAAYYAFTEKRWDDYGMLLNEHWRIKRERASGITSPAIDALYAAGLRAGALGGKLVGAGGGGFLCFYTNDPERLRAAMGLTELTFGWDREGATCM